MMTGLSMREMAKMTGINYSILSSYEVGRFPVFQCHRKILSRALAMPESVLFGDEG